MGKDDNNQEFLRKLDHFDRAGNRILHWIVVNLYAVFTGTRWKESSRFLRSGRSINEKSILKQQGKNR
jgi:hypothetical protein